MQKEIKANQLLLGRHYSPHMKKMTDSQDSDEVFPPLALPIASQIFFKKKKSVEALIKNPDPCPVACSLLFLKKATAKLLKRTT